MSVSHFSTESEIISLDAGLRMDGLPALGLCDVVIEVLHSTNNTKRPMRLAPGNWCGTGNHSNNKTKTKNTNWKEQPRCWPIVQMWTTCLQTHILLKASLSCTSLKTTKQSSRWLSMDEVQQWDTCAEPTELRLIGCSTESFLNQRSKSIMLTPKTNSRTFLAKRFFYTWWVESSSSFF